MDLSIWVFIHYIWVHYADDLSLLCSSFSGLKEMLNICERYANDKKITFNASKSQLLYFSKKDDPLHIKKSILRMKHGQIIPYVEKCIHLGNTLNSSSIEHAMLDSAIIDLKCWWCHALYLLHK